MSSDFFNGLAFGLCGTGVPDFADTSDFGKGYLAGAELRRNRCLTAVTFASGEAFTLTTANTTKNWDGTLYYSTNASVWNEWDGTSIASAEHRGEQRIYVRGSGNSLITGGNTNYRWVLTGSEIRCTGNIENLLNYEAVANGEHPTMAEACFNAMFRDCTALTTAPELPAVNLADNCYENMFYGCTGLTVAPKLPAAALTNYCYSNMFYGCTNLTRAPELPATTLADYCYYYMFYGCTKLATTPVLPAATLASYCYGHMFQNCTALKIAPKLPVTTLAVGCYHSMFSGCTSLITLTILPAIELANFCYHSMFEGCTNIKLSETKTDEYQNEYRIPISGTGTAEYLGRSLQEMFTGTGGTYTGSGNYIDVTYKKAPSINTTYYTSNEVV